MSGASHALPSGFEDLEPFAAFWAVAGAANRAGLRHESREADRAAFYNALKDRLADALAFLDKKPLARLDEKEQRLMNLLLSFAHVSLAVEVQADDEAKHTQVRRYLTITKAPADSSCSKETQ
jgi:hypothetical protein